MPLSSGQFVNPAAVLFNQCCSYLVGNGVAEKNARSLLGKWRKDFGDGAVVEVVSDANGRGVSDPVAWIEAALRKRHGSKTADGGWL